MTREAAAILGRGIAGSIHGCAIGIDVGGTKIAAGILRMPAAECLETRRAPTHAGRSGDAVLEDVLELIEELRRVAESRHAIVPTQVGLGLAELVGPAGEVLSAATINWRGLDPTARIHAASGLPARIDADVRAAALGEALLGAAIDLDVWLYVTIGTGISAALVSNGVPFLGANGLTGTFASAPTLVPLNDGSWGKGVPLESFASGPAIAARYARAQVGFSGTAEDVVSRAGSGDALATDILMSSGRAVGAAIGQMVNVLDPEAVVVGGGLGLNSVLYREALRAGVNEFVWADVHRGIPIRSAGLEASAGWIGAALGALTFGDRRP